MANNQNNSKLKSMVFHSMMSNPKLSKIISEGLDAPIGSTKREKARSTMAVMEKLLSKQDGQGGLPMMDYASSPGVSTSSAPMDIDDDYDQMIIFPSVPKAKKKQQEDDGQGGFTDYLKSVWDAPFAYKQDPNMTPGLATQFSQGVADLFPRLAKTAVTGATAGALGLTGLLEQGVSGASRAISGYRKGETAIPKWSSTVSGQIYNKGFDQLTPKTPVQSNTINGDTLPTTPGLNWLPGAPKLTPPTPAQKAAGTLSSTNIPGVGPLSSAPGALQTKGATTQTGNTPSSQGEVTTGDSGATQGPAYTGGSSSYSSESSSSSGTPGVGTSGSPGSGASATLQKIADESVDADAFWTTLASNPTLWHEAFGANSEAPAGASLSASLVDLQNKLKEEHNINSRLDELTQMKNAGPQLTQNLNDYIKARDTYITDLDKTIDETKSKMNASDLGNPTTAGTMGAYLNYLYTLKGKQSKRYADYVSDSTKDFENKYARLSDEYTNLSNEVNSEFTNQSAITTEAYNRRYAQITSLYNKLTDADGSVSNLNVTKANGIKAQLELLSLTKDAINGGSSSNSLNYYKQMGIDPSRVFVDSKGALLPDVDIKNELLKMVNSTYDEKTGAKYSIDGPVSVIVGGFGPELANATTPDQKMSIISNRINQIQALGQDTTTPGAQQAAQNLMSEYIPKAASSIKDYATENFSPLRSAIDQLTASGWLSGGKPKYTADNIQTWINSNSTSVNKDILKLIADFYVAEQKRSPSTATAAYILPGKDPESLSAQISNLFSQTI